MTRNTGTRTGLKDISIRLISEFPIPLAGGRIYCEYGLPVRYLRVDEREVKLEISLEKLRSIVRYCDDPFGVIDRVLEEVSFNFPEAILTVARVYADGVKIRELSYLEETTSVGRGIILDETREPDEGMPLHARENREKVLKTLREIITLEILYSL